MLTGPNEAGSPGCGRALAAAVGLAAVFVLVFRLVPEIDLTVSGFFHNPATGFALADRGLWDAILLANKTAAIAFATTAVVLLVMHLIRRRTADGLALRYWLLVGLLYLLGPTLLVNGFMKRFFGRARPVQIEAFGGKGPFTAAWQVSGYCHAACSFVSAEVAAGTALTVGLAIGARWFKGRRTARLFGALSLCAGGLLVLTSVERIGSGRHFLSDVVFAVLTVTVLGIVLECLLKPATAGGSPPSPAGSIP